MYVFDSCCSNVLQSIACATRVSKAIVNSQLVTCVLVCLVLFERMHVATAVLEQCKNKWLRARILGDRALIACHVLDGYLLSWCQDGVRVTSCAAHVDDGVRHVWLVYVHVAVKASAGVWVCKRISSPALY